MRPETTVTCPECETEFRPVDTTVWHVCLTCGDIWPPGDEWRSHHKNDDVDCDGVHAVREYSESDALERQERVRSDA